MNYRLISIADRDRCNELLRDAPWMNGYVNSELVFENLYPWAETDQIEIAYGDDFALIRCNRLGARSYFPPIAGTMDAFQTAIKALRIEDEEPLMVGLTERMLAMLPNDVGIVLYDDLLAEYIHSAEELAELKGSKFHRRRNLFSQFQKNHPHQTTAYDPKYRGDVIDLLDRYVSQGGDDTDRRPILRALDAIDTLPIFGLLLWVETKLVALSIGTVTPYGAGVVLFEKADVEYVGSYIAIAKYASAGPLSGVKEISRQEDLGLPHLRKAKLANQPLRKEKKYAWLASRKMAELHRLYSVAFPEDAKPYIDYVFLNQTSSERAFALETTGKIVAGLHALPRQMSFLGRIWSVDLIVGAAVLPEARGKGHLKTVLAQAIRAAYARETAFLCLSPVDESVYRSSGFQTVGSVRPLGSILPAVPVELEATVNVATLMRLYQIAVHHKDGWFVRDEARWYDWMNSLWQDQYVVSLIKKDGQPIGYVAHRGFAIEELLLIEDVLPVAPGFDFSKASVPSAEGTPSHMVRISHLPTFWSNLRIDPDIREVVCVRFVDPIVPGNNLVCELEAKDGLVSVKESVRADWIVSIDELAQIAFVGNPSHPLSRWFAHRAIVLYDRY